MTKVEAAITDILFAHLRGEISKNEADSSIKELLEKPEEDKPKHWPGMHRINEGSMFCESLFDGGTARASGTTAQFKIRREHGDCSETKEEAEFVKRQREAKLEVVDMLQKLNEDWRPDYTDAEQEKWEPYLNHTSGEIYFSCWCNVQAHPDYFQAKSKEIWKQLEEELGTDKIRLAIWGK